MNALAGVGADDRGRDVRGAVAAGSQPARRGNASDVVDLSRPAPRNRTRPRERNDRHRGSRRGARGSLAPPTGRRRCAGAGSAADPALRLRHRRCAAVAAFVAHSARGAICVYLVLGSPNLPGQPLAQRFAAPADANSIAGLIARVETHLERNPDDGRGWDVIAPVYMRLGRFDDAIRAYRNALKLEGETADRQASLGEALAGAAGGVITTDAKGAFERALALDESNAARAILSRARRRTGWPRREAGRPLAQPDRTRAPPTRPGSRTCARRWRESSHRGAADPRRSMRPAALGPKRAGCRQRRRDVASERDQMVRGMVERLAARLSADGSDVEGWLRLMRAYMVLGERRQGARGRRRCAARARQRRPTSCVVSMRAPRISVSTDDAQEAPARR